MMLLPKFLVTLFLLVPLSSALLGGHLATQDINPRIYCGRSLARVIAQICYDYPSITDKRSNAGTMYGNLIPGYYGKEQQDNHLGWPMMAMKDSALGGMRGKRFTSGGVADECCDKPCSVSKLLDYC